MTPKLNVIVLVIHHMQKSKKKKEKKDMIFKLDLEKAYDRVYWRFPKQTLSLFGFPSC